LGRNIDRLVVIADLSGLSLQTLKGVSLFRIAANLDSRYFPETVERVYVVNAPWVFPAAYKVVSPFIDPITKTKIVVCTASDQKELLSRDIDPSQLPKEYGGTNEDCAPHAQPQQILDELKLKEEAMEDIQTTTITIAAKDSQQVSLEVPKGGMVGWYFKLDSKDIDFSVEFVLDAKGSGIKTVVSQVRCSNHDGNFHAEGPGTCYFNFNNKYSVMTAKTVKYNVAVTEPLA